MTDADESEVSSESDSFGARYTSTVSFSVSVIETLITLPDGRSGRTRTVSFGASNSFLSLANGGYGSSSSEGTLGNVTIDSTMVDNNVVLSTSSTPGGNGHSVSSSGSFISYANASTSFGATATVTVADGDSPADAEPSGSASFSTESAAGSASDSSLNGSYQSSGAGGFEHVTIESSKASSGARHFNYSNSATFGPAAVPSGSNADLDTGSGGGFDSSEQIIYASSQGPGNDPNAQTTTKTVAKIKATANGGSSNSRTLDEIDISGGSSITGSINVSTVTNSVYQYSPTSIWTIDTVQTLNLSASEASGIKYNLTDNTFDFEPTFSGDISINDTTNYYHEIDSWDLDSAGNPVNNSIHKYNVVDSYELKFKGSDAEEPDGHILHTLYSEMETIGGFNPMPKVTHLETFVNVGLGASAPPPSTARPIESILAEYRDRREQIYRLQDALANETNPDRATYLQDVINDHTNILNDLANEASAAGISPSTLTQIDNEAAAAAANDPIELQTIDEFNDAYIDSAAPGYGHFLMNPSDMDDDLETGFYLAAGTAAAAAGGAAALTWGPALLAASTELTLPTLSWVPGGMTIGEGGMLVATGGGLAVGTTSVTVTGAQAAAAVGVVSGLVFMARKPDLKAIDQVAREVGGLSKPQREMLHREITKMNYPIKVIKQIAEDIKRMFPNS